MAPFKLRRLKGSWICLSPTNLKLLRNFLEEISSTSKNTQTLVLLFFTSDSVMSQMSPPLVYTMYLTVTPPSIKAGKSATWQSWRQLCGGTRYSGKRPKFNRSDGKRSFISNFKRWICLTCAIPKMDMFSSDCNLYAHQEECLSTCSKILDAAEIMFWDVEFGLWT